MILTITLNASIDKTAKIENFKAEKINRIDKPYEMAGGKGLNVTRALKAYNLNSLSTGFIGGKSGERLKELLELDNIDYDFLKIKDNNRFCLALVDMVNNKITEINENGPFINNNELKEFLEKVDFLSKKCKIAVMAGSVPKSLPNNIYYQLIKICKKNNLITALDASGEHLKQGLGAYPYIIKPNQQESEELLGFSLDSVESYLKAIHFLTHYCQIAVVTLEDKGCIIGNKSEIYHLVPPEIKVVNSVGSGDSFLAGMIYALTENKNILDIGLYGIATGTANTLTETAGFCKREDIDRILKEISIEKLL
ncbi:MAG: 1-phosphofructokinase family hexose kinase [Candidatus Sericytochromatia bacterium]